MANFLHAVLARRRARRIRHRQHKRAAIRVAGNLAAGRYFAVALYREGGHWICPDYTHDDRDPKLGEVSNLCYGDGGPPCLVKLQVKPDHHLHSPAP